MAVERRTSWAIRVLAMVAAIAATLPACGGGGGAGDAEGTTSPATSLGVASTSVSESAAETTGSLSEEPTTGESVASDPPVSGEVGGGAGAGTTPRSTTPRTTAVTTTSAPTTAAPAYPIYSSCQSMDISVVNGWRATEGVPALSGSSSLNASACAWSRHMAETRVLAHSGAGAEVVGVTGNFAFTWAGWKNSPSHYGILTSPPPGSIGCGMVKVQVDYFTYEWYGTCQLQ